jgi:hypothetical protein
VIPTFFLIFFCSEEKKHVPLPYQNKTFLQHYNHNAYEEFITYQNPDEFAFPIAHLDNIERSTLNQPRQVLG